MSETSSSLFSERKVVSPHDLSDKKSKPLTGLIILLAEDNRINQQVIYSFLSSYGAHVSVADNGLDAIRLLNSKPCDIVLMDVQMPHLGGLEATLQIRQNLKYERLPIIGMSAAMTGQVYRDCRECGMSDFISKPVNPVRLIYLIKEWVGRQRYFNLEKELNSSDLGFEQHKDALTQDMGSGRSSQSNESIGILPDLEGFDLETSLLMVGEPRLVLEFLKIFYLDSIDLTSRLEPLIRAKDWGAAQHITHQFIGSTGILGANKLHYAAERLDREFQANSLAKHIYDDFTNELSDTSRNIKHFLDLYGIL